MKHRGEQLGLVMILSIALLDGKAVYAQGSTQTPAPAPAPADKDKSKPQTVTPLTLDSAPAPVNAEEDAAIKVFRDAPITDVPKKDQLAEDFLQKYPQSRYRPEVYMWLVKGYLSVGQVDKMEAAGDKEIELMPNDAQTMAILASTLPRAINSSMSEADKLKRLDKGEQYAKKALDILPTLPKPPEMTDEVFNNAKNQTMAMAYSGLGVAAFRRGKYAEAIPNLEQSVKLDPIPDPVNYYLLGVSNQKASHFDDAVTAFTKCAALPGGLQATCKSSVDEAKKLAATQLSAPK
jgi:tetratricopeptide (TPR) repeat protein